MKPIIFKNYDDVFRWVDRTYNLRTERNIINAAREIVVWNRKGPRWGDDWSTYLTEKLGLWEDVPHAIFELLGDRCGCEIVPGRERCPEYLGKGTNVVSIRVASDLAIINHLCAGDIINAWMRPMTVTFYCSWCGDDSTKATMWVGCHPNYGDKKPFCPRHFPEGLADEPSGSHYGSIRSATP